MSADNGVYILKTEGNEFRIKHIQAQENLYFLGLERLDDLVSLRLVEYYYNSKVFNTLEDVEKEAEELEEYFGYLEYGIIVLSVNKTWEEIIKEAKIQFPIEEGKLFLLGFEDFYREPEGEEFTELQKLEGLDLFSDKGGNLYQLGVILESI